MDLISCCSDLRFDLKFGPLKIRYLTMIFDSKFEICTSLALYDSQFIGPTSVLFLDHRLTDFHYFVVRTATSTNISSFKRRFSSFLITVGSEYFSVNQIFSVAYCHLLL